ncbi:hypothetical protein C5167_017914 [Papaver somniferum]|uniref:Uncharacterized protein n=1 Tax=Papaver somniferum TaxID=3469 RepID=A0A4Y7IPR5_PAPSO|nr:hypothetical protein C5167_017914 [Papaver somniferum]
MPHRALLMIQVSLLEDFDVYVLMIDLHMTKYENSSSRVRIMLTECLMLQSTLTHGVAREKHKFVEKWKQKSVIREKRR